jgi:hypothetical protein
VAIQGVSVPGIVLLPLSSCAMRHYASQTSSYRVCYPASGLDLHSRVLSICVRGLVVISDRDFLAVSVAKELLKKFRDSIALFAGNVAGSIKR